MGIRVTVGGVDVTDKVTLREHGPGHRSVYFPSHMAHPAFHFGDVVRYTGYEDERLDENLVVITTEGADITSLLDPRSGKVYRETKDASMWRRVG